MIEMATGAEYFHKPEVPRGIDPTYILTPQFRHPIFGPLVLGRYLDRAYQAAGFICYLGVAPLGLALVAAVRRRKRSALWVVIGLGAFILALGLNPFWDGDLSRGRDAALRPASIPIPLFGEMNVANRFLILTSLALAVLAGMGWSSAEKAFFAAFLGARERDPVRVSLAPLSSAGREVLLRLRAASRRREPRGGARHSLPPKEPHGA